MVLRSLGQFKSKWMTVAAASLRIRRDDVALEVTLFILKKAADEQLHGSSPAGGEPRLIGRHRTLLG